MGTHSYRPCYHASVLSGWANDPNGLIWYQGRAHLFFQHNPKEPRFGQMYWGHMCSQDMVHWEPLPIALSPTEFYERGGGCYSGSAVRCDEKLLLMYTGSTLFRQTQCVAESQDGINFKKSPANPVIRSAQVPRGFSRRDFRDPKVFRHEKKFYCLVGGRKGNTGDVLLYCSADGREWHRAGTLFQHDPLKICGVIECPDYIDTGEGEILLGSIQTKHQEKSGFPNAQTAIYIPGRLDLHTGRFHHQGRYVPVDYGFDFYAPQTMALPDKRIVMIAWMNLWGRTYPTAAEGWAGSFTLPREISCRNGKLYQSPIKELCAYRKDPVRLQNIELGKNSATQIDGVSGNKIELSLTIKTGGALRVGVRLLKGPMHHAEIFYSRADNAVVFDRSRSGKQIRGREKNVDTRSCKIELQDGLLKMRIFIDVSCIEVFINDGQYVMTGNVYPNLEVDKEIEFFSESESSTVVSLEKYEIVNPTKDCGKNCL